MTEPTPALEVLDTELARLLGRTPTPTGTLTPVAASPYAIVHLLDPVDLIEPAPELGRGAHVRTPLPAGALVAVEVNNADTPRRVVVLSGPLAGAVALVNLAALAAAADHPDRFLNTPMTDAQHAAEHRHA